MRILYSGRLVCFVLGSPSLRCLAVGKRRAQGGNVCWGMERGARTREATPTPTPVLGQRHSPTSRPPMLPHGTTSTLGREAGRGPHASVRQATHTCGVVR